MKYNFLFKPVFFIFSLLTASWLVLKIEKLSPSDFGKPGTLFEKEEKKISETAQKKIENLFSDFKTGKIDSAEFFSEMHRFLKKSK